MVVISNLYLITRVLTITEQKNEQKCSFVTPFSVWFRYLSSEYFSSVGAVIDNHYGKPGAFFTTRTYHPVRN